MPGSVRRLYQWNYILKGHEGLDTDSETDSVEHGTRCDCVICWDLLFLYFSFSFFLSFLSYSW